MKYSNFHITVNFNVDNAGLIDSMRRSVEAMVEAPYLWKWLRHFDGTQQLDFNDGDAHLVESVRLRAGFEHEGKHNKGLHVHIVVEVAHTTMVQVSKHGVCEIMREFVGLNPNCHCRFIRGTGEDKDFILHYLLKEIPSYTPQSQLNSRLKYALMPGKDQVDAEVTL